MQNKTPVALFIFSNDMDNYLHNIENEKKQIRLALEPYHETNRLMIIMESFTSKAELIRLFQRYEGRIVIFHFSGHAGSKGLQLNENIINTDTAYADGIAGFIAKEAKKKLKLVFLNGCSTAPQVAALKVVGVSNIIATNFPISDNKATHFATYFYRTMANAAKDNPFREKPITIQDSFESAKNYLQATYKTPMIEETNRGFVVDAIEYFEEPWELYTEKPNWYLPNVRIRNWLLIALVCLLPLFAAYGLYSYLLSQTPLDLKITLDNKTPNAELPPLNATVTITYKGKTEKHENITDATTFQNLFRSQSDKVELSFQAKGFEAKDTTFQLRKGIKLPVWRDDTYAVLQGKIIDEDGNALANVEVTVQGQTKVTNKSGIFKFNFLPEQQRPNQRLDISKIGYQSKSIETPILPNEDVRLLMIKNK